ncbi:kinase-like domain-containing protein [Gigaspora rosea]|uniref:Kinase-like domain-containing protein n=1 Tax=Gigaspora rosea TaxID=44941 RepID=A0A397VZX6_9GLOM|nr:kinase-like domain-containing protein [Gigaspora rosea]
MMTDYNIQSSEKILLEYSEQLEICLKELNIRNFDYSQYSNLKIIGQGGSATVYSTTFKEKTYALKSLNNNLCLDGSAFKKLVHELKLLSTADHTNIVKFYGISRNPITKNFMIILQFANDGNLRDYLKQRHEKGLYKILWTELMQIAIGIAIGLAYLHKKNIVHRDLHSKNILINDGKVLIADFGIAKQLNDSISLSSSSGIMGMPAYIDPQYFQSGANFKLDKQSDIYSLGVLFWELTSGAPPFNNLPAEAIILDIINNKREKIIPNTPLDYVCLYKECWSYIPAKRPTLDEVLIKLKMLSAETSIEFMINDMNTDNSIKSRVGKHYSSVDEIIKESNINFYNESSDFEQISENKFGQVEKAYWKSRGLIVTLNNLNIDETNIHEVIKEIQSIAKVNFHSHIRHFYGIAKDYNNACYFLIMQYTNGCNLQEYLKKIFNKLTWSDKLRIALQIAEGLVELHKNRIIFKELNSKNILVHDGRIIINFVISKWTNIESAIVTHADYWAPAYIDPQYLKDNKYERDEKSNIYSFGVILWEISSGRPPFNLIGEYEIIYQIFQGKRETFVEDTPIPYAQLCARCWDEEPDNRPDIQEVFVALQLALDEIVEEPIQISGENFLSDPDSNFLQTDSNSN